MLVCFSAMLGSPLGPGCRLIAGFPGLGGFPTARTGGGRKVVCDFSVFALFTGMTVHSSLVNSFIFYWCEGVQSLSKRNHRQQKGAKREKRNRPARPFFGA